ncbi:MAG: recombinase family protein, partial [Planctomycetes bacterium]|nr:recombinase family protein [Planctomycetota bacterium]
LAGQQQRFTLEKNRRFPRTGQLGLAEDGATLFPNEAEQEIRRDIRALRSKGMTLEKIAGELSSRGVPTKTGKSDRWTHQAVGRILRRSEQL